MTIPRYLTKSRFKLALECPAKHYYTGMKEYANTHDSDEFLKTLAEGGYQVDDLGSIIYAILLQKPEDMQSNTTFEKPPKRFGFTNC